MVISQFIDLFSPDFHHWDSSFLCEQNGAGICTPTFARRKSPSFVGKYTSTMEQMGYNWYNCGHNCISLYWTFIPAPWWAYGLGPGRIEIQRHVQCWHQRSEIVPLQLKVFVAKFLTRWRQKRHATPYLFVAELIMVYGRYNELVTIPSGKLA